ncbi:hypothetical protein PHMEG_0008270 [Phytophthora megakarya]|uniref:Uncharacterized protein n=1 Tax=Phytophthora megakarya TaxID=4795 RepID=A0A225WJK7_9STRA|nr:hypothetical protein PHMEG_0008270 [Phytophthora megakarya]
MTFIFVMLGLELYMYVKIRIFQSAWTAKYLFKMEPATLENVDVLQAKLQDVEEELETTKKRLNVSWRRRKSV